jgi:hypothetical protein
MSDLTEEKARRCVAYYEKRNKKDEFILIDAPDYFMAKGYLERVEQEKHLKERIAELEEQIRWVLAVAPSPCFLDDSCEYELSSRYRFKKILEGK